MVHKLSRLLSDADSTVDFVGANPVLAVHDLPHDHEPFIETQGGVFEDRSRLRGELTKAMLRATLPAIVPGLEQHLGSAATRASDAIGPAVGHQILAAVVRTGKVEDCFLKCA